MEMKRLPGDIWQFDLVECGIPGRTSGYLVKGMAGWLLVETGPATSLDRLTAAVSALQIKEEELLYIGITHIHLDHAGGVGVTAQKFPRAKVLVHERGARHVIDPGRLIKGATAVWGEAKMVKFGPLLPVPEGQVIAVNEGDQFDLGDRVITVWDTPGHSRHHLCFYDSKTHGLFTGDAAGIYQPLLSRRLGKLVLRTATPPPDFDENAMLATLKRIALNELAVLYFTHFGALTQPLQAMEQLIGQLILQMELARKYVGVPNSRQLLAEDLAKHIKRGLGITNLDDLVGENEDVLRHEWHFMTGLLKLSAAGSLHYLGEDMGGAIA